ncbi:TPA: hypothetical protein N0F65_007315 [Lagenidium giganteum]|uniref:Tyr recombinase domain-containing protein n=1 Tax=Lagenidium giganteum TaxID=4803 RepID=A0AAV2Z391_9STRA|nr:TPA: hypothetical protein N0F65_007315 [Lagenidium giganteum]
MGRDRARYSTHSLRSGGATALLAAGTPDLAIKTLGIWRSNAVDRYVHFLPDTTVQWR